jgi:membrane peptidoglycan carboxypeptidase
VEAGISLDSVWDGTSPQTIDGYRVTNYGDESYGPISLLTATERSVNTAYVNLEREIGVEAVADAARRAGLGEQTPGVLPLNLTFVLGTASPSAMDMAGCYATFAAGGARTAPTVISRVEGPEGSSLLVHRASPQQVFAPDVAVEVTSALAAVVTNGSGQAALALGRPAAGKTGTTDDNLSAWFVGYTPQVSAAVVLAKEDDQGRPVSLAGTGGLDLVTGGSFPAQIWTAFAQGALAGQPSLDFPRLSSDSLAPPTSPPPLPDPARTRDSRGPTNDSSSATRSSDSSAASSSVTGAPSDATESATPSPTVTSATSSEVTSPDPSTEPSPDPATSAPSVTPTDESPSAASSDATPPVTSADPEPSDTTSRAASSDSGGSGSTTSATSRSSATAETHSSSRARSP